MHVLWPEATIEAPFAGGLEWFPAIVAIAAFVALWKHKQDVLRVLGACAVIGVVYTFILP